MESHDKHWLCPYNCPDTFTSSEGFERHLQVEHLVEAPMLATLSKSCASKRIMATYHACTLCKRPITASDLWKHVGHHLEQLALFAVPSHLLSNDSDNDHDVVSSAEEMSTHSAVAEDATDALSDHGIIEGRLVHGHMDPSDDVEDLPEKILLERWDETLQPEVLDDSMPVAHSDATSSMQDHDTHITERISSLDPNPNQPTPGAPESSGEQHRCPHCSTTFRRYHNLKSHLLTHLPENITDRLALRESAVLSDRQPTPVVPESPAKERRCPYCSTTFERSQDFKTHLLTHSQEKPYVCQTCDARFQRLHDLKRHNKLHKGERPHTCDTCGRRFARADALARHTNPVCAGRRSDGEEFSVEEKGMEGAEYPEEDLDVFGTIENIDILNDGEPMRTRRKLDLPKLYGNVDDL
jgi:uncharacterized C2H2 Zn-finger protein